MLVARDGEEALAEFHAHLGEIALAVFDLLLPRLSGPEAYVRISSEISNFPVVLASGYSTDPAPLTKIDHFAASFLRKRTRLATWATRFRKPCNQPAGVLPPNPVDTSALRVLFPGYCMTPTKRLVNWKANRNTKV